MDPNFELKLLIIKVNWIEYPFNLFLTLVSQIWAFIYMYIYNQTVQSFQLIKQKMIAHVFYYFR